MEMRLQKIGHALTPRAFERWDRTLGAGARFWVQGLQIKKEYHLAARSLGSKPAYHTTRIGALESQILHLQSGTCLSLHEMHEKLFMTSPTPHWLLDTNGVFVDVNQSTLTLFGYTREEMVGRMRVFDLLVVDEVDEARLNFNLRIEGSTEGALLPKSAPRRYRTKDGTVIYGETKNALIRNGGNRIKFVLTSFRDVTQEVLMHQALEKAAAREQMAVLGTFAANLSHDLRQRLVVVGTNMGTLAVLHARLEAVLEIITAAARINCPVDLPSLQEILTEIAVKIAACSRSIREMERTAERLLSPSHTHKEVFSVMRAANDLVDEIDGAVKKHGCDIVLVFKNLGETDGILADESGFKDLLSNLIMNAAQSYPAAFDPAVPREVRVNIFKNRAGDRIIIVVNDRGSGIEPDLAIRLFKERVPSTKPDGHGLGLFGVKGFVDASGGRIGVVSRPGRGSTFTVEFPHVPYTPASEKKARVFVPPSLKQKLASVTAYVVDDEPRVLEVFLENLKTLGFNVISFNEPAAALARYRAAEAKPQLVITDLTMPQMNGDALIREILALSPGAHPRFVLCSGKDIGLLEDSEPLKAFTLRHAVTCLVKGSTLDLFTTLVLDEAERILGISLSLTDMAQEQTTYLPLISHLRGPIAAIESDLQEFDTWAELHFRDDSFERRHAQQLFDAYEALNDAINGVAAALRGENPSRSVAILCEIYRERLLRFREQTAEFIRRAAGGENPIEEISAANNDLQRFHRALLLAEDAPEEEIEKTIRLYDLLLTLDATPS